MNRVVMIGTGAYFPDPYGAAPFDIHFDRLFTGETAIRKLDQPVQGKGGVNISHAAWVSEVVCDKKIFPHDLTKHAGDGIKMALVATDIALKESGLPRSGLAINAEVIDPFRIATFGGTGLGDAVFYNECYDSFKRNEWGKINAHAIAGMMPSGSTTTIAKMAGAQGESDTSSVACASSSMAFVKAFRCIRDGDADVAIVLGVETLPLSYFPVVFGRCRALSSTGRSIPFGSDRDGFVLSEAAACGILISLQTALRLDLDDRIIAEVVGCGITTDAKDMFAPDFASGLEAVNKALRSSAGEIDVVCAHGTSTLKGDQNEADIIQEALKDQKRQVYVTGIKAPLGHPLGPAGLEAALDAAYILLEGRIPSMGHYEIDLACQHELLRFVVNGSVKDAKIRRALVNSFAFGGQNVSVVLQKYEG